MAQISMEIMPPPGSVLVGNQHHELRWLRQWSYVDANLQYRLDHAARTQRLGKMSSQPQAGHLTTTSCGRISSAATGMLSPHLQHVNAGLGDLVRRLVKVWLLLSKTVETLSGVDQEPTAATLRIGSNFLNNDMRLWAIAKFQRQEAFAVAKR